MTDTDITACADRLIQLLEQQQELVDQLAELADRQAALIEAGRTEPLLSLLAGRQQVMDQFVTSQDRLAEMTGLLRGARGQLAHETQDRISSLLGTITGRLSEIMRRDERDRDALQVNRDQTRRELTGLGTARQAHRAYVTSKTVSNRFADRQG